MVGRMLIQTKKQKISRAVKNADDRMIKEADRQMDLNFGSWLIALKRHYGYGSRRLGGVIHEMTNAFQTIGADNSISMVSQLDTETGIEMQIGDGTTWRDHAFLNGNSDWNDGRDMTEAQWIYMRNQQFKWCSASIEATILLVMYRKYGWSADRDTKLLEHMRAIKREFNYDQVAIRQKCEEETGIKYGRTKQGHIFVYPHYPFCKTCKISNYSECDNCEQKEKYEMEYYK